MLARIWKEYATTILLTLVALGLFSAWDLLAPPEVKQFPLPLPVASADLQSIYAWQPIIKAMVQHGNPFPSEPSLNPETQGIRLLPYLTLWTYALMVGIFSAAGAAWIGQTLLPAISFALLARIYHRQVDLRWSVTLAAVGVVAFSGYPFHEFLIGLARGISWRDLGATQRPEITLSPIPAISTCLFLVLFLISTKPRKLTATRVTVLTILWSLFCEIHAIDALFGLAFWFTFFPIRYWRQHGSVVDAKLKLFVLAQAAIAVLFTSPVWGYMLTHPSVHVAGTDALFAGLYYNTAYFLLPLLALATAYVICRIDPYEVLTRFWHIYVLLVLECLFVNTLAYLGMQADLDSAKNRIALFFLHFYYYLPAIYFFSRSQSHLAITPLNKAAHTLFTTASRFYLPCILMLIGLFAFASAARHSEVTRQSLKDITPAIKQYEAAKTLPPGSRVVFDSPIANLWVDVDMNSQLRSVWINRFSNDVDEATSLNLLASSTLMLGWPLETFTEFMKDGAIQKSGNAAISWSDAGIRNGLGYWLVYHKTPATFDQANKVLDDIIAAYNPLKAEEILRQAGVRYIISRPGNPPAVPARHVGDMDGAGIYELGK